MMLRAVLILSVLAAGIGHLAGAVPSRPPETRYTKLHQDSPFTSKPIPTGPAEIANPLEDYALGGISRLDGGYYVILFNKKKAGEKIVIRPGADNNQFQVQEVKWSDKSWKETEVVLRSGARTGTVTFEDKFLQVKAAAPAAQKKPAPQKKATPTPQPNNRQGQPGNRRTPRPRVVVPPKQ